MDGVTGFMIAAVEVCPDAVAEMSLFYFIFISSRL